LVILEMGLADLDCNPSSCCSGMTSIVSPHPAIG
jgi:hypothetical protein